MPRARPSRTAASKTLRCAAAAETAASRKAGPAANRAIAALCRWWRPNTRRIAARCGGAGVRAEQGGPPGQRAGGHRVEDALAGQRVDRRGGVPGQQHPPVGMEPRAGRQRQVVPAHRRRVRFLPGSRACSASRYCRRLPLPRRSNTPYPTFARPSAERERPARTPGSGRRANSMVIASGSGRPGRTRGWPPPVAAAGRRRCAQQPADRRVGPVRADHHAGGDLRRRARPGRRARSQLAHPVPAQLGAPGDRGVDQRGVEHQPRDHPVRRGARPGRPAAARGAQPQPRHRRRQRVQARDAQRGEQVEHLGGDPVPAGLVPRERRPRPAAARGSPGAPAAPAARRRCRPDRPRPRPRRRRSSSPARHLGEDARWPGAETGISAR